MVANLTCPHCQKPISPGAPVCPHCGTQLQAEVEQSKIPESQVTKNLPDVVKQFDQSATTNTQIAGVASQVTKNLPDVVKQFDQSATTNTQIAGVLIAFYSGAIFAGKVGAGDWVHALVYALPPCLLLVAIILALTVFYPNGYLTDDHLTLIKKKEQRLRFSSIFLEVAVGVLIISVVVYLLRPGA